MLNIIAGVCLLLWGTQRVKKGFTRAFGVRLHDVIGGATKNRIQAFFTGMGVTALLQSSTATILLLTSFAKHGLIPLGTALAIVIGADVGTTLVAQALTFDLSFVMPVLLSVGIILFMLHRDGDVRTHIGRICMGLGLMLLSLDLIRNAVAPIKESDILPVILGALGRDIVFTMFILSLIHI